MSDIQPGDVVVCVPFSEGRCDWTHHANDDGPPELVVGHYYRVTVFHQGDAEGCTSVELHGMNNGVRGWCISRFRRLNDGEDDTELIARIKQCKPARIPTLEPIQTLPVKLDPGVWPLNEEMK